MVKRVEVDIHLFGDGSVKQTAPGLFEGGVPDPQLSGAVQFAVSIPTELENAPISYRGDLQVQISATAQGYRDLARYLLSLAELDTTEDPDFHDHQDGLISTDGDVRLDLIFRKQE